MQPDGDTQKKWTMPDVRRQEDDDETIKNYTILHKLHNKRKTHVYN